METNLNKTHTKPTWKTYSKATLRNRQRIPIQTKKFPTCPTNPTLEFPMQASSQTHWHNQAIHTQT